MITPASAARLFAVLVAGVVVFQLALAAGAPLGHYAMGGAFPGTFPPALRVAAVVQAVILTGLAIVLLARAGVAFARLGRPARWLAWVVVGVSAVAAVLNIITPSGPERMVWAPVGVAMLLLSLRVALAR